MKISFTIIAYNEEKNIANCINSILNQEELKDYEIVAVNDASNDKTSEIVKDLIKKNKHIKLVDLKENRGRGNARFVGVENSRGDYIAFVDADCILPKNWLKVCLSYLKEYDAVGGIAVPDGDVTYISQRFNLTPKIIPHTTGITGSNAIYKREIFKKIKLNSNLRGGEDTDLNWNIHKAGFKIKLIPELIVKHKENINYTQSVKRMFSFGKGATKLLKRHKKIRLPDLAFFGFIILLIWNLFLIFIGEFRYILLVILYPLLTSFLHLYSKFKMNNILNFIIACFFNYFLMLFYYYGRIIGFFKDE